MLHKNPFQHGNPVPSEQLKGRNNEIRRIVGRIVTEQSTAITGPFRCGKTSILNYLSNPKKTAELYGEENAHRLIFSYLDICTLDRQSNPAQFWELVLQPLQEKIANSSALSQAYQICQEKRFSTSALEKLFKQADDWRLVLMLDEFNVLLRTPNLNNAEFFGGLRVLASRTEGALTLVITSNISLLQLNQDTQQLNSTGSPYFNIMDEVVLGALSSSAIDELLHQDEIHLDEDDRQFIKEIAGGYPDFLQVAASVLWEIYEDGEEENPLNRRQQAKQELSHKIEETLDKIWQFWLPNTRDAFLAVALAHLKTLDKSLEIEIEERDFSPQWYELKKHGFVEKEDSRGWRVCCGILLDFAQLALENRRDKPAREELARKESRDKPAHEESHAREGDEMRENLFMPSFIILMFIGTFLGERLGYILTHEHFLMLPIFSGAEPLSIYLFKFFCAVSGAVLGYYMAIFLKRKGLPKNK
jgi:AAA+ ATPase superfamily predicted ATPase